MTCRLLLVPEGWLPNPPEAESLMRSGIVVACWPGADVPASEIVLRLAKRADMVAVVGLHDEPSRLLLQRHDVHVLNGLPALAEGMGPRSGPTNVRLHWAPELGSQYDGMSEPVSLEHIQHAITQLGGGRELLEATASSFETLVAQALPAPLRLPVVHLVPQPYLEMLRQFPGLSPTPYERIERARDMAIATLRRELDGSLQRLHGAPPPTSQGPEPNMVVDMAHAVQILYRYLLCSVVRTILSAPLPGTEPTLLISVRDEEKPYGLAPRTAVVVERGDQFGYWGPSGTVPSSSLPAHWAYTESADAGRTALVHVHPRNLLRLAEEGVMCPGWDRIVPGLTLIDGQTARTREFGRALAALQNPERDLILQPAHGVWSAAATSTGAAWRIAMAESLAERLLSCLV